MPRLTAIHWKKLKKIFEKAGFVHHRTEGSHMAMVKEGVPRPVMIPKHNKPLGVDIIKANMRTAGISRDEYFKLLDSI